MNLLFALLQMHSPEGHPSSPHLNVNGEKELSVSERETQQGYTSKKHEKVRCLLFRMYFVLK